MNALKQAMNQIPESEEIYKAMILDWIDNADPGELENMELEEWKDLIRETYKDKVRGEQGNIPNNQIVMPFTDQEYIAMLNAFKAYIRHIENQQQEGGKRRRNRRGKAKKNRRQTKKKTRRGPKKTRKHK